MTVSSSGSATDSIQERGRSADAPGKARAPGQRKKIQDEILGSGTQPPPVTTQPSSDPVPVPPPVATQPSSSPVPVTPPVSNDIRSLAGRYVAQYERVAQRTLTDEERQAKIADVERFYSGSRISRLQRIVFA